MDELMKTRKQQIHNQNGLALIGMIIGIFIAVGALFLYAATYYQEMNVEVERMKRNIGGISIMQQLATYAHRARQIHEQAVPPGTCPAGTFEEGDFCFDDARGSCVENPFNSATPLCIDSGDGAGPVDRVLVTMNWAPPDGILKAVEQRMIAGMYNLGGWVSGWIGQIDDHARAIAPNVDLPDLAPPTPAPLDIDLTPTNCPNGTPAPFGNATCLRCNTIGTGEHACIVFRVCVRGAGLGGCDPGNDGQWLWQTVLVTDPVPGP